MTLRDSAPESHPEPGVCEATASEVFTIDRTIQEAFDRCTIAMDQAGPLPADLPYSTSTDAFGKRMSDVHGHRRERIDLKQRWKAMMRSHFPDYSFDRDRLDHIWFRKPLAAGLDGVLLVKKVFLGGMQKCFTLKYAPDFPGGRFAELQSLPGVPLFARNLFTLFHQGLWFEEPQWAYSSSEELAHVLEACRTVLQRALPSLEAQLTSLLSPLPTDVPEGVPVAGGLTALQAYARAKALAALQSDDAAPVGILSMPFPLPSMQPAVEFDGRLQRHGTWQIQFVSERLDSWIQVEVPHTGRLRWNTRTLEKSIGEFSRIRLGAVDSIEVMLKAREALEKFVQNGELEHYRVDWGPDLAQPEGVWRVTAGLRPVEPFVSRSMILHIDQDTGQLLRTSSK